MGANPLIGQKNYEVARGVKNGAGSRRMTKTNKNNNLDELNDDTEQALNLCLT
jgi:hypothetical protein